MQARLLFRFAAATLWLAVSAGATACAPGDDEASRRGARSQPLVTGTIPPAGDPSALLQFTNQQLKRYPGLLAALSPDAARAYGEMTLAMSDSAVSRREKQQMRPLVATLHRDLLFLQRVLGGGASLNTTAPGQVLIRVLGHRTSERFDTWWADLTDAERRLVSRPSFVKCASRISQVSGGFGPAARDIVVTGLYVQSLDPGAASVTMSYRLVQDHVARSGQATAVPADDRWSIALEPAWRSAFSRGRCPITGERT